MPLSEHEQRLLEQMEQALSAEDPKLASTLQSAGTLRYMRRRIYLAVLGFVISIALLMTGVAIRIIPISVIGFLGMLTCALLAVSTWRRAPAAGHVLASSGLSPPRVARKSRMIDRIEERWRRRRDEHDL